MFSWRNTTFFFLMIRRPPRSTQSRSSAASDVYKRQPDPGPERLRRRARRHDALDQGPSRTGCAASLHRLPSRLEDARPARDVCRHAPAGARDRARERPALGLHRKRLRPRGTEHALLHLRGDARRPGRLRDRRLGAHRGRAVPGVRRPLPRSLRRRSGNVGRAAGPRPPGRVMKSIRVRPPAVAGMFYPASPPALARHVDALLAAAKGPLAGPLPAALVVPHAGTIYSGPVAATAYERLRPHAESICLLYTS